VLAGFIFAGKRLTGSQEHLRGLLSMPMAGTAFHPSPPCPSRWPRQCVSYQRISKPGQRILEHRTSRRSLRHLVVNLDMRSAQAWFTTPLSQLAEDMAGLSKEVLSLKRNMRPSAGAPSLQLCRLAPSASPSEQRRSGGHPSGLPHLEELNVLQEIQPPALQGVRESLEGKLAVMAGVIRDMEAP
jgi:hypothetical protein